VAWKAVKNKKIVNNPMDGIGTNVPEKAKTRKPSFTEEEARKILSETLRPPHAHAGEEWASAKRWIPWICPYSGARVNEVTQHRGKDLSRHTFGDEEVWVITITPEAGTVKNKQARQVPLHSHIFEQGFPAFVAHRGEGPLFYDSARNRGSVENPPYKKVGDKLAVWVREIGVDHPKVSPKSRLAPSIPEGGSETEDVPRDPGTRSRAISLAPKARSMTATSTRT
jgi:hypothetical protein